MSIRKILSQPQQTILHVDINSYFASILQQENPILRGKPLGVIKDPGRTCLIAASKEAKKYGVKTGSLLKEALLLCPKIITVPATFARYLDATKKLKKIFESLSPEIEIYSLDEAFINLTHCRQYLYPDVKKFGFKVQRLIKQALGKWVTCSVGISYNRFLAKMASEISPPESIFEINQHNLDSILASVELKDVCGIGQRLGKKLQQLGINHPYLIRFFSDQELEPIFGPFWTQELKKMAYGQEPHHLQLLNSPLPYMKSVGRSITGYKLYDDETSIKRILYNLTEEIIHKVRQMNLAGRYIEVYLQGGTDFRLKTHANLSWRQHATLQYYLNHTQPIFEILYHQLYIRWTRKFPIIKFGVRLGMLKPLATLTLPLLPAWHQQEKIAQIKDQINQKYGLFTLRSGILLNQEIIRPEVTGFLGDKRYQLAD